MAMDLTSISDQIWEDLRDYVEGSEAVIGEMMLPVLEPISQAAKPPAVARVGVPAHQLLCGIDEDLDRGRGLHAAG
jgi:phytoene synthase